MATQMRNVFISVLMSVACVSVGHAEPLVKLDETILFKNLAHDCKPVDLASWHHPTREVLAKKKATLTGVALCNKGLYPIFYVQFPYDPQGQTRDYFMPLYDEMRKANGSHPLAFVDENTIVYLNFMAPNRWKIEYEMFAR
jgi:hypothetical protein